MMRLQGALVALGRVLVVGFWVLLGAVVLSAVWLTVAALVLNAGAREPVGPLAALVALGALSLYVAATVFPVVMPLWAVGWAVASWVASDRGMAPHRTGRAACIVAALAVLAGLAFSRAGLAGTAPFGMLAMVAAPGVLLSAVLVGRWSYPVPVSR